MAVFYGMVGDSMEILTVLKGNIKHHKGAFISVAFLLFIIALSFATIISLNDNQKKDVEAANELAETGDYVVFISDALVDKDLFAKLEANKNVSQVEDRTGLAVEEPVVAGAVSSNFMILMPYESYQEKYQIFNDQADGCIDSLELSTGEILVPDSFKMVYDCKKGDTFEIESVKGKETFTIKGFLQEPFLGAAPIGIKQVFISEKDYARLYELQADAKENVDKLFRYHLIHINQSEDSTLSLGEFQRDINEDTNIAEYSISLTREASKEYTLIFTTILSGILYVFMILLFLIVLIVISHNISTSVEMDYVDLGILKAQGFTKGKIRLVYVLQYMTAGILGVAFGCIGAYPVLSVLARNMQQITGILASNHISWLKCGIMLGGLLFLLIVFVFLKTRKIAKIAPVRAISGGRDSIYFDSRMKMPIRKNGLGGWLAFRQFTSAKRQYIGAILIVAILVFFMMAVTTLATCITTTSMLEIFGVSVGDISVGAVSDFDTEDIEKIEQEVQKKVNITSSDFAAMDYFTLDGASYQVTVHDKPAEMKNIISGRAPLYENEIVVTEILAELLGKKIGDEVKVGYKGAEETYLIVGTYQSTMDVGKCFAISLQGARRLKEEYYVTYGYISLENQECIDEVVALLNEEFGTILTAEKNDDADYLDSSLGVAVNAVTTLIYIISMVFALVVVRMVCGKTFLREKCDIGIYKALGFTTWNLRLQFAVRFLIVAIIGSGLGVCLSVCVNDKLLSLLLYAMGVTRFQTDFTVATLLGPSLLICACFFLFSFMASKKVKKVEVRELIVE